jgi:hypothetical protein
MKGIWKWISLAAGIFLVMACVGLVAAVGIGGRFIMMGRGYQQRLPIDPGRGFNPGFGHWMMPGGGLMGLGFVLVILVLFALVGVGLYLALRKQPQVSTTAQVAAPTQGAAPQGQAAGPVASTVATATSPCSHCGQPVQAGWVACPYCGEKV